MIDFLIMRPKRRTLPVTHPLGGSHRPGPDISQAVLFDPRNRIVEFSLSWKSFAILSALFVCSA